MSEIDLTPKQQLPNSTAVLILGILSLLGCCCYGIVGIILAIIAFVLAKKDTALYKANPEKYTGYGNIQAGVILAIVGLVLSILYLIFVGFVISIVGIENLQNQEAIQEALQRYFES